MTSTEKFELNDSSYERLMRIHTKNLRVHAYRLTRNQDSADDLFQETSIKIYMNLDKCQDENKFCAWAKRIMQNLFLDKKRFDARRPKTTSFDELEWLYGGSEVEFADPKVDIESEFLLKEVQAMNSRQVRGMISNISPTYSSALSMNTYGNSNPLDETISIPMSYDDIALQTKTNINTVKVRLFRARAALAAVAQQADFKSE
jgi:RNA polymerase sigma-70 factor (ECF subfamily)